MTGRYDKYHFCDRDEGWAEYDLNGHFLAFVCEKCVDAKIKDYWTIVQKQLKADAEVKND
tara:strand:+ start:1028 stop:1207 length:180 start_codon:yes stop_codon:yes gene_type:complete